LANDNDAFMDRLALFPISTKIKHDSLTIAGHDIASLADRYLTPLYIYDRATLDSCAADYQSALRKYYPAPSHVTYAGKAFLCKAIAAWTQTHGFFVDCTGEGEIAIALAGGVPREHILVHGVNKSIPDLQAAIKHAGTIVVDNPSELKQIKSLFPIPNSRFPSLWLRLLPGVAVHTHHAHTQTGQHDSKFGMTRDEIHGSREGIAKSTNSRSQGFTSTRVPTSATRSRCSPPATWRSTSPKRSVSGVSGISVPAAGGGWRIMRTNCRNRPLRVTCAGIAESVAEGCQARGLDLPHLHLEPGRSLIAQAGVAVYRVGAVKRRGEKTWLLTDGGMADNLRFALYGARYSCLPVAGVSRERSERVSVAGSVL
jgi:diaminopimelate decarboxylase